MRASFASNPTSPLNRIDVRVKMLIAAAASIMTVAISSEAAQYLLFASSFVYLLLLKRPKIIAVSYCACILMMALSAGFGYLISIWFPAMGKSMSLSSMLVPFLRGFTMLNVVLPLAFTGRLQTILSGLQKLRLPFVIYLPSAVIIRFIPTFMNDIRQIWESLKIRGYKINPWTCTIHPLQTTRLLFTPLFFRALKTSDELGIAAELKGLNSGSSAGRANAASFSRNDYLIILLIVLICAAAAVLQFYFPNSAPAAMK